MLQGVCSPFMLTTPTIGLAIAASSSPIARMNARCGARSRPSVVIRDRSFFIRASSSCNVPDHPGRRDLLAWFSRPIALLKRSDNRRMLELGDIQFWQHPCLRVDVQHLLDRGKFGAAP